MDFSSAVSYQRFSVDEFIFKYIVGLSEANFHMKFQLGELFFSWTNFRLVISEGCLKCWFLMKFVFVSKSLLTIFYLPNLFYFNPKVIEFSLRCLCVLVTVPFVFFQLFFSSVPLTNIFLLKCCWCFWV